MHGSNLAVTVDDLRRDIREALDLARHMGFSAVDARAVSGPLSPGELSESGRRHLRRHLGDLGLRLASLRGPASGPGYADPASGERRIDTARRILDLASALGVPVVTTALGAWIEPAWLDSSRPEDDSASETESGRRVAARAREALAILADHADRCGVILAIETAGLPAKSLARLLAERDCPFLAACCDSGGLLMQGEDPARIGEALAGRIRSARVRDAQRGSAAAPGHETAPGEGHLDVAAFLSGLAQSGYEGDLVVTRSEGGAARQDIERMRDLVLGIRRDVFKP